MDSVQSKEFAPVKAAIALNSKTKRSLSECIAAFKAHTKTPEYKQARIVNVSQLGTKRELEGDTYLGLSYDEFKDAQVENRYYSYKEHKALT